MATSGLTIRLATDADFRAFYDKEPPELWTAMCGERDGKIVGIGGIVYSDDGVAMGFMDAYERPSVALHRAAIRFMTTMRAVKEPVIFTTCQNDIARAGDWLLRLGFKMTPDIIDDMRVWRWQP